MNVYNLKGLWYYCILSTPEHAAWSTWVKALARIPMIPAYFAPNDVVHGVGITL